MALVNGHDAVGPTWHVLLVAPNRELAVAVQLMTRRAGCLPYVPYTTVRRHKNGVKSRPQGQMISTQRPLFPGYVFARFDFARKSELTGVAGVVGILQFCGRAATLTDAEIALVRAAEEAKAVPAEYHPGDLVEIMEGA